MQIRHLFLTSLLLSTPALAFPALQDQEAPSQEIIELAERARAQAELARVEVDLLLEQVETSREGVEAKHLSLATRAMALEGQDPDRGYLGINMAIEGEAMVVRAVMPGSGADKAGLKAGDRILRVNKIMLDQEGAEEKLKGLKAGKKAKVTFERDGEEKKVTVSLSPLSAFDQDGGPSVQVNRLRRVIDVEEGEGEGRPTRRFRVRTPINVDVDVEVDSPEGLARVMRDGAEGGNVLFFGPGEGSGSKIADHDEDSGTFEVHLRAAPGGKRLRLQDSQDVEILVEGDHSESDSTRSFGRAIVKRLSGDGQDHVIELKLGGQDFEGLPGNIREHIHELLREHGGEGEHQLRIRMDRDHEGEGNEHDVHVMHLGDGGGTWVMKDGDHVPLEQRRVELFSGEGDGRHVTREFGVDLEGLPEHIRELIKEHRGDGDEGAHGIFIIDGEHGDEHDAEEHEVRVLHLGGGGGRDLRFGGEGNFSIDVEVEHDGHRDHDGPEVNGRAIIKMLTGDGERRMEFDLDGAGLREMGGRVRQLMAGRDIDLWDVLARVRGDRNDRPGGDSRGLHREEDHDGREDRGERNERGDSDSRGLHREEDHDGREDRGERNERGDRDSRGLHREEDHDGREDRGGRNGRGDRDSRGLHREEDHDGRGDRGPRGMRQEPDRGMDRSRASGRGRGMGMMRGRGRGGPEMIPHEEHKDQLFNEMREIWQQRLDPRGVREIPIRREGENRIVIELPGSAAQMNDAGHRESENFRERIEELEQRIEELEELLERVRGRRNR